MTPNTTPEKPEWFELADGDAPSSQVKKVNKKLPAIAVLVTGAVIASGAFFAHASEGKGGEGNFTESFDPGNAGNAGFDPLHNGGPQDIPPAMSDTSTAQGVKPPHVGPTGAPQPGLPPQGMQPPVPGVGGEDGKDDRFEHHDGGRNHEEDDERGEHEGRGNAPTIPNSNSKIVN